MITTGIILIILGTLVNRLKWYNLIIGYNTLSKEDKSKIDKKKLGRNFELLMILFGGMLISINFSFEYFDLVHYEKIVLYALFVVVIIVNSFYWSKVGRADYGKKIFTGVLLFILVSMLMIFIFSSPNCRVDNRTVECEGLFGFSIDCENIDCLELINSLPAVKSKSSGCCFLGILKGYFKTSEYGECKFQLDTKIGKYIFIKTRNGSVLFVNTGDVEHTESLYRRIKNEIN